MLNTNTNTSDSVNDFVDFLPDPTNTNMNTDAFPEVIWLRGIRPFGKAMTMSNMYTNDFPEMARPRLRPRPITIADTNKLSKPEMV